MALTLTSIVPADPHRNYSFTDHSTYQPSQPPPGDRIDAEFDAIYAILADIAASLHLATQPRPRITIQDLDPGVLAALQDTLRQSLQPLISQIHAAGANTIAQADRARSDATRAQVAANQATTYLATTEELRDQIVTGNAEIGAWLTETENDTKDAANSANDAAESAILADRFADLAGAWAEYMEGGNPIPSRFFANTEVTGDHWSSRWWANRAAGAFGQLSELYLGAHPTPPTTTSTGDPIPIGAIYYNTTNNQTYVWNGTAWMPLTQPAIGSVASLAYSATANQQVFDTTLPDITGSTHPITDATTLDVHVNGVRTLIDDPAGAGDYAVDRVASTVTFVRPLLAGSIVQIDVVSTVTVVAGIVVVVSLLDFDIDPVTGNPGQIDGTRKIFPLALASDHTAIDVTRSSDVSVSIDGVTQQPDRDYTALGNQITFTEAPLPGARAWGIWYSPVPLPARLIVTDLPTVDPHTLNQLWNKGGAVMVSQG